MSAASEAIANYWETHATEATAKKSAFLAGLQESGTVTHAARLAGISRYTAYQWRNIDRDFRFEWESILEDVTDNVERSLYNQAVSEKNVVATIFYLKGNRRAKYGDRVAFDVHAVTNEIEDRLGQLNELPSPASSPSSQSTKDIIAEVLNGPRQLRADNDPDI